MQYPKAVIFDLDDTLYQEEEYVKSGFYMFLDLLVKKLRLIKIMYLNNFFTI